MKSVYEISINSEKKWLADNCFETSHPCRALAMPYGTGNGVPLSIYLDLVLDQSQSVSSSSVVVDDLQSDVQRSRSFVDSIQIVSKLF